jgi:site-specific recombinase XerC
MSTGKKMCKLEWESRTIIGKLRRGSSHTRKDTLNCLRNIGRCMQRYGLNSIRDIKPKHVERYFGELREKGLSAGRMANHASTMRKLCNMMGKSDIVPSNRQLGCTRDMENRTKHADERLNHAKYVDVKSKLSPNNQIAYDMSRFFGLRQKESLLSHRTVLVDGVQKLIVEGTKGNRPREIPITTQEQRTVIDRNHSYRSEHGGKLIREEKSLAQGLKQIQNELSKAGATKTGGGNMHSLRREWIIENCLQILSSPEAGREAKIEELIDLVGHGRREVISAYTSLLA